MSNIDPFAIFPIDYVDWNGQQRLFYVFPEAIRTEGGHRKLDFLVRTSPKTPPPGTDRVFQFDLEEINGEWRIVMIGQLDGYREFETCGLPERVILTVAERFHLPIRSSSLKRPTQQGESRTDHATTVWQRLADIAAETGEWRVEYDEDMDVFRLIKEERGPDT